MVTKINNTQSLQQLSSQSFGEVIQVRTKIKTYLKSIIKRANII